jgi:quercetin dioxygenase-like cupin family protein
MAAMTHTTATPTTGYSLSAGEGERIWIAGDTLSIKASAATTGGSLSLVECEATPGAGPPPHIHLNEDESFYVLEGEFAFLVGEHTVTGGPGTFAFVPRGTVHRFECTGRRPGRLLVMFTPGGMDGFFREAGRPATDAGPAPPLDAEEIARTNAAAERYGLRVVTWERSAPATA